MQKAQSPNWASWVARTGDTSGAPVSFVVLKAVLTSSASAFSSGGPAAARTGDADSFTSSPAQPVTAKHTSTVNIGDTDNLSLPTRRERPRMSNVVTLSNSRSEIRKCRRRTQRSIHRSVKLKSEPATKKPRLLCRGEKRNASGLAAAAAITPEQSTPTSWG